MSAPRIPARSDQPRGLALRAGAPPADLHALLEKGFGLAYLMIHDRTESIEIVTAAASKLESQRGREKKRMYWRQGSLKNKITKIIRPEQDVLQWLICLESTPYEQRKEKNSPPTTRDLVIRYVKHLAQITTPLSSFHVSIGIQRLLHNYTTPEVQKAYEWLTEHYPSAVTYRMAKRNLMQQLATRFDGYIATCTMDYGEQRFAILPDQESWAALTAYCLRILTPWSTSQTCRLFQPDSSFYPGRGTENQDVAEMHRCHIFMEPDCHDALARKVGLERPTQRLSLPQFLNVRSDGDNGPEDLGHDNESITDEEIEAIMDRVAQKSHRRKHESPRLLRILAHGTECARISAVEADEAHCELGEGTTLLEVWSVRSDGDILLATHWIDYTEWDGVAPALATVDLHNGRELWLDVRRIAENGDKPRSISLDLKCQPKSLVVRLKESLSRPAKRSFMPRLLVPISALAFAGIVGVLVYQRELKQQNRAMERIGEELTQQKQLVASLKRQFGAGQNVGATPFLLIADEFVSRGAENAGGRVVSVPAGAAAVNIDLVVGAGDQTSYRAILRSGSEEPEILSENALKPHKAGSDNVLSFAIPTSLIEDRQRYVIDLYSLKHQGRPERIHSYSFDLIKRQ